MRTRSVTSCRLPEMCGTGGALFSRSGSGSIELKGASILGRGGASGAPQTRPGLPSSLVSANEVWKQEFGGGEKPEHPEFITSST